MKRRTSAAFFLFAAVALGRAMAACVGDYTGTDDASDGGNDGPATTSQPTGTPTGSTPPGGDAGHPAATKDNGLSCKTGTECTSGFCVDGFCCQSKCDGVCETCGSTAKPGECMPIGAGTDPDNECVPEPLPDAGDPDASADAAPDPDATVVNLPPDDAGLVLQATPCAGSCDGKRACAFPGTTTSCGSKYCNDGNDQARASCDGKGRCQVGVEACAPFTCNAGAADAGCATSCAAPTDCQDGYFCDVNGNCQKQKANGVQCTTALQCASGHCPSAAGVCCNDECEVPGGTCAKAGSIGQCVCNACATGPCKLWYRDRDGDGHGDKNATTSNGDAIPGCANAPSGGTLTPPAAGFVESNDDCYDVPDTLGPSVHPGQTSFYSVGYGPGNTNFDYDCSGQPEKETLEDLNGCGYCAYPVIIMSGGDVEPTAGGGGFNYCFNYAGCPSSTSTVQTGHSCNGCAASSFYAFHSHVNCGATSSLVNCGTCSGGYPQQTYSQTTQRCH